jgi:hypothetical protein
VLCRRTLRLVLAGQPAFRTKQAVTGQGRRACERPDGVHPVLRGDAGDHRHCAKVAHGQRTATGAAGNCRLRTRGS